MTEGKRNIIQGLRQEYNIESATDIQEALKDLLRGMIKEMMESEDHFDVCKGMATRQISKTLVDIQKYPRTMKRWYDNRDAISPIFKFSKDVRMVIYTINAIESLNSTYRQLNSQRSVFPNDMVLLKALYLATFEATKEWTMPIRNWGRVYGELAIMYDGRLTD